MTDSNIAETPEPPYYAVIFTSQRSSTDADGYAAMADRMLRLAAQQDGYLGVDSVRGADGLGITVSYWRDHESIKRWHKLAEHRSAQQQGRASWYEQFQAHVCRIERAFRFAPQSNERGN